MDVGLTIGDSLDRLDATIEGFDLAELSIGEGTAPEEIDATRLESLLDDADADLCVHLPFKQDVVTPVPVINDAIVDYLTRLLEWAGEANARKAVLHGTARNPHDMDLRPLFADQLAAIDAAAADAGVELVVENVGHQKRGLQLSVLGDLARETGTSVCFDVGHAYMEDGNDGVDRFLSGYRDLVSHLHVHDARSRGDTHIPIGAGEIDYDVVTDHLAGFDGTVAVEVFTDDVPLLRETARRARAALEADSEP
ncbi:sugar phosphate isomerase/epimerase family protein [Natronolimnohabitans innermongolicus]|uniref:Xylose isomerase domain-containing protein TIM barrel n=1 Tax=Natronolimnohabitans innermongolicus JCM 12255 TaxID=1227499 RepID=L9XAC7_9EURY|nr:sugar phosphate isomerase/epimerase [Natronolimnohabitans innermongolicus]ELY58709.1 Xylose isomerase domain-containing protein TIM barrel [Natronolimnohabitans innermongolicus JCM 12255]